MDEEIERRVRKARSLVETNADEIAQFNREELNKRADIAGEAARKAAEAELRPLLKFFAELQGQTIGLSDSLKSISERSKAGALIPPDEIQQTTAGLVRLSTVFEEVKDKSSDLFEDIDLEKGFAEKFTKQIGSLLGVLQKVDPDSRKAQAQLEALRESVRKLVDEFPERGDTRLRTIDLDIVKDNLPDTARVLEEIFQRVEAVNSEYQQAIQALYRDESTRGLANELRAIQNQVASQEFNIAILGERKKLEEELLNLQEAATGETEKQAENLRSQLVTLESYAQRLQESVLSEDRAAEARERQRKSSFDRAIELQRGLSRIDTIRSLGQQGLTAEEFLQRGRAVNQFDELAAAKNLFSRLSESVMAEQISRYLEPYLAPLAPLLESMRGVQSDTKDVIQKKDERARAVQ